MKVLVIGGAGYIGAHTARALRDAGHQPVLFDNLSLGHAEVARRLGLPLIVGDLNRIDEVATALTANQIEAVMHFAAFAAVGESVVDPGKYYHNNVAGTIALLRAMQSEGVKKIIFSSTCATYGVPQRPTIDEQHVQRPVNPYGWSKWMVEQMLRDFNAAHSIQFVALRYFNAAGASSDGLLGEEHDPETHLIPLCLQVAAGQRASLMMFGTDYDTPDGTCIRDYIHVEDLASAHVLGLDYLSKGGEATAINVGTGTGHSVRQVIRCAERISGKPIKVIEGPRRPGDPPELVAAADKIRNLFGWQPKYPDLESMVRTAWRWFEIGGKYA